MKKKVVLHFDLGQVCNDMLAKCNLISKSVKEEAAEDIKASILTPDDPETRCIVNRAVTEAFGRVKVACQRYLTVGRLEDDNNLERLVKSVTYIKEPVEVQDKDDEGHLLFKTTNLYVLDDATYISGFTGITYTGTGTMVSAGTIDDTPVYKVEGVVDDLIVKKISDDNYMPVGSILSEGFEPEAFLEGLHEVTHEEMVETDEIASIEYEIVTLTLLINNFNLAVTDDLKSAIHKFVVDYVMAAFLQDQHADKAAEYKALADGEDYRKIVLDLNARENYTMRKPSFM